MEKSCNSNYCSLSTKKKKQLASNSPLHSNRIICDINGPDLDSPQLFLSGTSPAQDILSNAWFKEMHQIPSNWGLTSDRIPFKEIRILKIHKRSIDVFSKPEKFFKYVPGNTLDVLCKLHHFMLPDLNSKPRVLIHSLEEDRVYDVAEIQRNVLIVDPFPKAQPSTSVRIPHKAPESVDLELGSEGEFYQSASTPLAYQQLEPRELAKLHLSSTPSSRTPLNCKRR